jgi:hypothetical protein
MAISTLNKAVFQTVDHVHKMDYCEVGFFEIVKIMIQSQSDHFCWEVHCQLVDLSSKVNKYDYDRLSTHQHWKNLNKFLNRAIRAIPFKYCCRLCLRL